MTVMGEPRMERLSDRGSIPLRSIKKQRAYLMCSLFFYCSSFKYSFISPSNISAVAICSAAFDFEAMKKSS